MPVTQLLDYLVEGVLLPALLCDSGHERACSWHTRQSLCVVLLVDLSLAIIASLQQTTIPSHMVDSGLAIHRHPPKNSYVDEFHEAMI